MPAVAELGTSASPRTDSGTIARSVDDAVTGSPRDSSQLRSAPDTTRQHDVVDRAAVRGADRAVGAPARCGRWRTGGRRRSRTFNGAPGARRLAVRAIESRPVAAPTTLPDGGHRVPGGRPGLVQHQPGPGHRLADRVHTSCTVARLGLRHPQLLDHLARLGRHVQDDLPDVDRADAVDHRLVGLGQRPRCAPGPGPPPGTSPTAGGSGPAGATSAGRPARSAGSSEPGLGSAERRTW